MAESELTVIRYSILVPDRAGHVVLAAGPILNTVLDESIPQVAKEIAEALAESPDKTIPVNADEIAAGIESGVSAAVIGLDGVVYGFGRLKNHVPEGGEVFDQGVTVNLPAAIEVGSMLGNWFAGRQAEVDPAVPSGQGARALDAVVHLARAEYPDRDVIAATNQTNGRGAGAVIRAGGRRIGYKPTIRLEHPLGEPLPGGPVMVDIYKMTPTGNFPVLKRGR